MATKRTPKPIFTSGQFFAAPVTESEEHITIRLPKKAAAYLNVRNGRLYWVPVNGVIQLSGGQPQMVIPLLSSETSQFVSHAKRRNQ